MSKDDFVQLARNNPVDALVMLWESLEAAELELASMRAAEPVAEEPAA